MKSTSRLGAGRAIALAVGAAVTAVVVHHDVAIRIDVFVATLAVALVTPWSVVVVATAGALSLAVDGELQTSHTSSFAVGLCAAVMLGMLLRRPADPLARPVRAALRLATPVGVALVAGGVEHLVVADSHSAGNAAELGMSILLGGFAAAVVV